MTKVAYFPGKREGERFVVKFLINKNSETLPSKCKLVKIRNPDSLELTDINRWSIIDQSCHDQKGKIRISRRHRYAKLLHAHISLNFSLTKHWLKSAQQISKQFRKLSGKHNKFAVSHTRMNHHEFECHSVGSDVSPVSGMSLRSSLSVKKPANEWNVGQPGLITVLLTNRLVSM